MMVWALRATRFPCEVWEPAEEGAAFSWWEVVRALVLPRAPGPGPSESEREFLSQSLLSSRPFHPHPHVCLF